MNRLIIHKGIDDERLGDAPFVGALIIASQCNGSCSGCFNQHLKEEPNLFDTADTILEKVERNPFNEGIILGGLEWTEQIEDMMDLVNTALLHHMQVMIYTRFTEEDFLNMVPELKGKPIWCKFGAYKEELKSDIHYSHGIKLATTNQYIRYLGGRKDES